MLPTNHGSCYSAAISYYHSDYNYVDINITKTAVAIQSGTVIGHFALAGSSTYTSGGIGHTNQLHSLSWVKQSVYFLDAMQLHNCVAHSHSGSLH